MTDRSSNGHDRGIIIDGENDVQILPDDSMAIDVEHAKKEAYEFGNLKPLASMMDTHPEEVSQDKEACKLIAAHLRGEEWRGRGKRGQSKKEHKLKEYFLLDYIYFVMGYYGYSAWDETKENACEIVSQTMEKLGYKKKTGQRIYKDIWRGHTKNARHEQEYKRGKAFGKLDGTNNEG